MSNIQWISTSYLKQNTAIENNVDDSLLTPYIVKAGDTHLQSLLGETFYNHLVDAFTNGTETSEETELKDKYIKPYIAELTYWMVFPHIRIKTTNKGVQKESAEFSSSAEYKESLWLRDSIKNIVDLYEIRLEKELKMGYNSGKYPLAKKFCDDNPVKRNNVSRMGIYMGKNI